MNAKDFQPNSIIATETGNFLGGLFQNGCPVLTGLLAGSNIVLNNNNDGTFTITSTTIVSGQAGSVSSFYSALATGYNEFWISYPTGFSANPVNVVCTLQASNPTKILGWILSGQSASGHYIHFTDNIPTSGYMLNSFVTF